MVPSPHPPCSNSLLAHVCTTCAVHHNCCEGGEEEDSGGEDMFGQNALDPLALLEDMEREAGEGGDVGARQPYQVGRQLNQVEFCFT